MGWERRTRSADSDASPPSESLLQSLGMAWPEGGWEGTREKRAPASAEGGRTARERKREASEIPEWIDRCYVIGAASSTPQEARSREREAVQQQGPPSSLSSSQKPGAGHPGRSSLLCFWCHRRWPPLAFGTPNSVLEVGNPPEKQRPLCVLLYLEVILEVCTSQGLGASHLGRVGAPPPSRPLSSTRVPEPHPAPRTAPGRAKERCQGAGFSVLFCFASSGLGSPARPPTLLGSGFRKKEARPCSPASIFVTLVTLCPLRPLNLLARTQRPLLSSQVRDWTGASDWLSLDPTPRPQLQGGPGRCYAEEEGGIQSFFEELTVQQGRQTHNYMACGDCCPEDVCKVLWEQEIP
ncbi:uncharacterized protein MIR9-1HG isoform X1 [Equus caballus]|uniref:uncharacterized protein MIR9-1HG isoform X1 n=1 Tax=Equus caballus TaxID=9796 RepID=UPI0038B3C6A2